MTLTAVLAPALFAGLVAIGVTIAIERWGGVVGGLVGSLPTTIVPAAAGISAQLPPEAFADAMYAVPVGMLIDVGFLYLWRWVPPRLPAWGTRGRLAATGGLALAAWGLLAGVAVMAMGAARGAGAPLILAGVGTAGTMIVVGVLACLDRPPAPGGSRPVGLVTLLARGVLAAAAIGAAVAIAALGGDLAAGVASVFPAIFLTTMVSLWLSQGEAVPSGAVGPMMLGASSVAVYALIASVTLPALGLVAGSAVAWVGAAGGVTVPAWLWMRR